ncbi:FAD-dependent oxidoreductase [Halopenitus persicus]|uniref:FAD-dependent oxidoreductase n=1 Tax=Halopenitus persicus TaxID=1048396 RepID=UPI00210D2306|nr:FAD-dependent oxidoreductase [Halopenitus persicus]
MCRACTGLYAVTPDHHPIIKETLPGSVNSIGFSGHGLMQSPATGKLVVDGKATSIDISSLTVERFDGRSPLSEDAVIDWVSGVRYRMVSEATCRYRTQTARDGSAAVVVGQQERCFQRRSGEFFHSYLRGVEYGSSYSCHEYSVGTVLRHQGGLRKVRLTRSRRQGYRPLQDRSARL